MQTIQLYADPDYYVNVVLEGQVYFLRFVWNSEAEFWAMNIEDFARNHLLAVKLLPNRRLISRYTVTGLPRGDFVIISDSRTIARTDFQDGYATLVYVSESEL